MTVARLAGGRDGVRTVCPGAGARLLALAGAALAGCAMLLSCSANGREAVHRAPAPVPLGAASPAAPEAPAAAAPGQTSPGESGAWYLLDNGGLRRSGGPEDDGIPFLPWTVQSRVAGFLQAGGRLFCAVNGWGVVALETDPITVSDAASFEDRAVFKGRTINGLYAEGRSVLVDLYRNTLFNTAAPLSPPVSVARINPANGGVVAEALPLTKAGWEASDVLHLRDGRWAMAWKRTTPRRVEFKYEMYAPATGAEQAISRTAFLDSYGYRAIDAAPQPLRAINSVIAETAGTSTVIDYLVRRPALAWVDRYRAGPAKKLFSGDADLLTVPVFRDGSAYYALAAGKVVVAGGTPGRTALFDPRSQSIPLPALPQGYAYTDLWCDGRQLVVSWERQRFTEVAAAGLFVRALADPGRVGARARANEQWAPER